MFIYHYQFRWSTSGKQPCQWHFVSYPFTDSGSNSVWWLLTWTVSTWETFDSAELDFPNFARSVSLLSLLFFFTTSFTFSDMAGLCMPVTVAAKQWNWKCSHPVVFRFCILTLHHYILYQHTFSRHTAGMLTVSATVLCSQVVFVVFVFECVYVSVCVSDIV